MNFEPPPTFEEAVDVLTAVVVSKLRQAPNEAVAVIRIGAPVLAALLQKTEIVPAGNGYDRKISIEMEPTGEVAVEEGSIVQ